MGYRIKSVAEMTGVPRNTLLAWERRYELVRPQRLGNGYRSYTEGDVDLLRRVKGLVDEGHAISEAVSLVREPAQALPGPSLEGPRGEIMDALLAFDHERAALLTRQLGMVPFEQLLDDLYLPLLRQIGERWAQGITTVAQEHFASAFVRERMTAMLTSLERRSPAGPRALLACFEGERHELGLMASAIRLALRGWRVTWLGADVPVADLLSTIEDVQPRLVGIAVIQPTAAVPLVRAARRIATAAPDGARVVMGGDGLPGELSSVEGVEWVRDAAEMLS